MKFKGFLVIQMEKKQNYLVKDTTQVAKLIGVHRNTVLRWFEDGCGTYIHDRWMIGKGYEVIKSTRGGNTSQNLIPKGKKEEG